MADATDQVAKHKRAKHTTATDSIAKDGVVKESVVIESAASSSGLETQQAQEISGQGSSEEWVTQRAVADSARDGERNAMPESARVHQRSEEAMSDSVEQARLRIAETRAEMSATIEEIRDKVSPQHLLQEAKEAAFDATVGKMENSMQLVLETGQIVSREVSATAEEIVAETRKTGHDVGNILRGAARRNPLFASVVGVGLCCLWLGIRMIREDFRTRRTL